MSMSSDNQLFLRTAKELALEAGELLQTMSQNSVAITFKGEVDLVTEADFRSEELIVGKLKEKFPSHQILAEEKSVGDREAEHLWIIDPLDGTVNYAHRFPVYAVSIALQIKGQVEIGVVYDPNLKELFEAERGGGSYLNGKAIQVSQVDDLNTALLATGFPYYLREQQGQIFERFKSASLYGQGVRRAGAATLDIAWLACGRLDGFYEEGLKPWDTAAAVLIAQEAGARISAFQSMPFDIWNGEIVGSNGKFHDDLVRILG